MALKCLPLLCIVLLQRRVVRSLTTSLRRAAFDPGSQFSSLLNESWMERWFAYLEFSRYCLIIINCRPVDFFRNLKSLWKLHGDTRRKSKARPVCNRTYTVGFSVRVCLR